MSRAGGSRRIRVLKTYDCIYAREVLAEMDEAARTCLWDALQLGDEYDASDTPAIDSPEMEDLLWDALLEESREDGNLRSFFIVTEDRGSRARELYVSPDWPSSEQFARSAIGEVGG